MRSKNQIRRSAADNSGETKKEHSWTDFREKLFANLSQGGEPFFSIEGTRGALQKFSEALQLHRSTTDRPNLVDEQEKP